MTAKRRWTPRGAPMADRILFHSDRSGECWLWTGAVNKGNGYGRIFAEGRVGYSHRLAYEAFVGPIPEGMHIDHLCRNRRCVRPDHLEPVTPAENNRRARAS